MLKRTFWLALALLGTSGTLFAMGRHMAKDADDTQFNAKAEGAKPSTHIVDATSEQKPEALPAAPGEVEKDTAKGFSDPYFKKSELDKDITEEEK